MFWTLLLGTLAGFSLTSTVWQWLAAMLFPVHQRLEKKVFAPPVTVLKPLKHADEHTAVCLESWLVQDYPGPIQIIFGVASEADPAGTLVKQLIHEHPGCDLQLVACNESLGANAKVSKLVQLERMARHEMIVVSDADVRVPPDFLSNAVAPLADHGVGLVSCFYRLANPTTLAMRWEAVGTNADFWSQVLQGRTLAPLDFALGAAMATRRENLRAIGGFAALADFLADDFQLGNRIARSGKRIELCPVVVECWDPPMGWWAVWSHQLRWQRTIRVCKPLPYALSLLANPLLWPVLWAVIQPSPWSLAFLGLSQVVRVSSVAGLLRRLNPPGEDWIWCWLAPMKDALQVVLWVAAFVGSRILWRGVNYRLRSDGRLVPVDADGATAGR